MAGLKPYSALIRTYNSSPLVFRVIEALRNQSFPPSMIVAVDSGTEDPSDLEKLKASVDKFVDISDQEFNYSRAINVGVMHCESDNVLIISSHLLLDDVNVMRDFTQALAMQAINVGFLISTPGERWKLREVNTTTFDGTNGLTNSCSFLPKIELENLPFREEVFSSEDQDWTARFLKMTNGNLLGISTERIKYLNPKFSYAKKLNEELALAYYVDKSRLRARRICEWMLKAIWSLFRRDLAKAKFRWAVAMGLIHARNHAPNKTSKYF